MRTTSQGLWITTIIIFALLAMSHAASANEFGVRAGTTLGSQAYRNQEIYWLRQLPIRLGNTTDWHMTSQLELNAGRLSTGDDALTTAGGSINFWFHPPSAPISVGIGTGPTYISRTQLADRDFGGHWQFTSHATARLQLVSNLDIGYRVQHTSNASLYSPNVGYDLQVLEIRLRF